MSANCSIIEAFDLGNAQQVTPELESRAFDAIETLPKVERLAVRAQLDGETPFQAAAREPDVIPRQIRDGYQRALKQLRSDAKLAL